MRANIPQLSTDDMAGTIDSFYPPCQHLSANETVSLRAWTDAVMTGSDLPLILTHFA